MCKKSLILLVLFATACVAQSTNGVQINASDGAVGFLRFQDADNSNRVTLAAPDTIGSNFTLLLPNALPGSSLCLAVDTSGVMSYSACSPGSSLTVRESDTTPTVVSVTTLQFNQANGFTVTDSGGGVATIGFSGGSGAPFVDTTSIVEGSADATKEIRFEVDGLTTGTVRVLTPQNANYIIAGTNLVQEFTSQQTFSGSLHMDSDVHVDVDSAYDLATISSRFQSGFFDVLDTDMLALSNNAHSTQWRIQRRSSAETYLDFEDTGGNVEFSIRDSAGVVLRAGAPGGNVSWDTGSLEIVGVSLTSSDMRVGPQTSPSSNNTEIGLYLDVRGRTSGGGATEASLKFSQNAAGSAAVLEPATGGVTFDLGSSGSPWSTMYTNALVVNTGATIDFGSGEADMSAANVYMRNIAASTGLSCGSVADGFMVTSDDGYIAICLGGTRYRVAVVSGW